MGFFGGEVVAVGVEGPVVVGGCLSASAGDIMSGLVEACLDNGFRKALSLAFWAIIGECKDYDEYGPGVVGLRRFLEGRREPIDYVGRVGVASNGRLLLYISDINEELEKLRIYRDIHQRVPVPLRRYLAVVAAALAGAPTEAYRFLLERADSLEPPVLSRLAVKVKEITEVMDEELLQKRLLEEEARVKEELLRDARADAEARMLAIAAALAEAEAPVDWARAVELWREGLLGMALSVLHEGILLMTASEFTPDDVEKLESLISTQNEENKTVRLLTFIKDYLKTARELSDVMEEQDYEKISAKLTSANEAWVKLGAHHAVVRVRGSIILVSYQDHNEERAEALHDFLARLGYEVAKNGGTVEVKVPFERSREFAKVLAATTSIDIQNAIWVLKEAASVDELLELRRRAVEDGDQEDEGEEAEDDSW